MRKIIGLSIACVFLALPGMAEEVKNGDFSKDLSYWRLNRHKSYGKTGDFDVKQGALLAEGLQPDAASYLSLIQPVNIRKGVKYKLRLKLKGDQGNLYRLALGDSLLKTFHFKPIKKTLQGGSDWETIEQEFTGKFDTDEKWVKDFEKLTKKNKLVKGQRTPHIPKSKQPRAKNYDVPSKTSLNILFGEMSGAFAIKDVSIVEMK